MSDLTDDQVRALLDSATPGRRVQFHGSYCPEAVGTPFTDWDTSHDVSVIRPDGSRYRLAHYKHAADAYLSQMAPDLAHALLAALDDLDAVKAERGVLKAAIEQLHGPLSVAALVARAEAAETALAAMAEREGVLRAFIYDFATAKIDALRYQPSYGESPEDEPDPVVDATEVWAWQSDAKDILALKETPDA